jgi:hypothetical protein
MHANALGLLVGLALFVSASFARADLSQVQVTIATDPGGAVVAKTNLDRRGSFSTPTLQPGAYTIMFHASTAGALKGRQFSLRARAGRQRVDADGVAGEKFAAGGVGMRLQVKNATKMTGEVLTPEAAAAAAESSAAKSGAKVKVMNGKRYIWVGPETGSQMGGRWVPEEEAGAPSKVERGRAQDLRDFQDRSGG